MNNIVGIYVCGGGVPAASEITRQVFCRLRERGVPHNQILFPYSDDLLLTGRLAGMFGTHALFCGIPAVVVSAAYSDVSGEAVQVRLPEDLFEIEAFLSENRAETERAVRWGDVARLVAGRGSDGRPPAWALREAARGLCSFAEHLSREGKHQILGYSGGGLLVKMTGESDLSEMGRVSRLLHRKTGGLQTPAFCGMINP